MHEPVSTNRGSNRWTLSNVRWVFRMMKTSIKAAIAEIVKKVTIYHCERSLALWCLMKSNMAAARDKNTCAHVTEMCMTVVSSEIGILYKG